MRHVSLKPLFLAAFLGAFSCASLAGTGETGGNPNNGHVSQQCQNNGQSCNSTADKYSGGGTVTTRADGSTQTYSRNSGTTSPSMTSNTVSAPFVVYIRNVNSAAATGPNGTGTATGTDCQYGQQLSYGQCQFSVQSGGKTGDVRSALSYTRKAGAWYDGAGSATCTASGWTFASAPTCTPTSNPGTSCGGCSHNPTSGWRCTFCD